MRDLLVFVHVPKTAGSSINAALRAGSPNGMDHAQNVINTPEGLRRISELDWVSGHISGKIFRERLSSVVRTPKLYSCLREPVAQLISHVNWLNEIRYRGRDFFYALSKDIHRISFHAGSVDYGNPCDVMHFLLEHEHLFLNNQSKYIFGPNFDKLTPDQRDEAVAGYEFIGTSENIRDLADRLGLKAIPRENTSEPRFDPAVFSSPELTDFLARYHRHDLELYERIARSPQRKILSVFRQVD